MTSFIMKLIVCPIAVIVSAWLFPNVNYGSYYEAILVGFVIAVAGTWMEYMLLKEGTLWISTFADFAAATLIVYFVSNLFRNASVTFTGALLTGALVAVVEHLTHLYLIRSGKTRKTAA